MTRRAIFIILPFVLLFCGRASAQLPNHVLIEEATNASCPPCAQQNPILEKFLRAHPEVLHIAYHAWWPGSNDPMYRNDITMNTHRITYYHFDTIGVPTCVVNGQYATPQSYYMGAPGDTNALIQAIGEADRMPIPVSMDVKRAVQGDSEQVTVIITAASDVISSYLRVAVVESLHNYTSAGTNGEKNFPNLVRKILPDYRGTKISLKTGSSQTLHFMYKHNPSAWTTDSLYIVAMLQDDNTRDVLGAVRTTAAPTQGFAAVAPVRPSALQLKLQANPVVGNMLLGTVVNVAEANVPVVLIDELGRIVAEDIAIGGVIRVNIQNFPSGAYRLIATSGATQMDELVMIEH